MTESDMAAFENALQTNPMALAEAEGHLKKGLLILSQEIGLTATSHLVGEILTRLQGELPFRRVH